MTATTSTDGAPSPGHSNGAVAADGAVGGPVTVTITRQVDPAHIDQMVAWMRAGSSLSERFPGFLGAGWVRSSVHSDEWHMLYRFDSAESLAGWEASGQRQWWLDSALGLVKESHRERHTGIEGWFEAPRDHANETPRPAQKAPPRWKQGTMIWFAFFPLSLAVGFVLSQVAPDLSLLPRVLVTTIVMTPIMTYAVLPVLTRAFGWWLRGEPPPWRRSRRA